MKLRSFDRRSLYEARLCYRMWRSRSRLRNLSQLFPSFSTSVRRQARGRLISWRPFHFKPMSLLDCGRLLHRHIGICGRAVLLNDCFARKLPFSAHEVEHRPTLMSSPQLARAFAVLQWTLSAGRIRARRLCNPSIVRSVAWVTNPRRSVSAATSAVMDIIARDLTKAATSASRLVKR